MSVQTNIQEVRQLGGHTQRSQRDPQSIGGIQNDLGALAAQERQLLQICIPLESHHTAAVFLRAHGQQRDRQVPVHVLGKPERQALSEQLEYAQESMLGAEVTLKLDSQIARSLLDYPVSTCSCRTT